MRDRLVNAGTLGAVDVPGSATLELPAGTVHVTFELRVQRRGRDVEFAYVRPDVELDTGGLPFSAARGAATVSNNDTGEYRGAWGTLEIPAAGAYAISANPLDPSQAGARLLFDA